MLRARRARLHPTIRESSDCLQSVTVLPPARRNENTIRREKNPEEGSWDFLTDLNTTKADRFETFCAVRSGELAISFCLSRWITNKTRSSAAMNAVY
jgi:hypothetical protein